MHSVTVALFERQSQFLNRSVCVYMCVCARARVCELCVCVCVCVCVCAVYVSVCVHTNMYKALAVDNSAQPADHRL